MGGIAMSKVVKLSSVMEREEKLKEIYEGLEEIKDQLTALIDEYEEEELHTGKAEELIEALDALEDASETIEDVLED
jgi:regulator of replication initiation timing